MSSIFLETLKLSLNFKTDWVATQDKGSCYINFIVQDVTSKTSSVEFITFAKMTINSKLGYFPFPIFICVYRVTSKQTQHMENCGLMLWTLSKVSEHAFFKEPDQPKQAKLNFDFDFFFIPCCSYCRKIGVASLKPQLLTHNDNFKFRVVIGIWMQLQNYQLSIKTFDRIIIFKC